eukprot:jgi/Bigna1/58321/fgenesh1_pm.74_\
MASSPEGKKPPEAVVRENGEVSLGLVTSSGMLVKPSTDISHAELGDLDTKSLSSIVKQRGLDEQHSAKMLAHVSEHLITWETLRNDIIGGLTVLVMLIPQAISYADIAGMPLISGLYSSFTSPLVYSFVGQSRQIGVGPEALAGILISASLEGMLTEEECPAFYDGSASGKTQSELCPEAYHKLGILLAFMVGLIQMIGSILQFGFIISFLGHPVISGFMSGAAVQIGCTQVNNLLGIKIEKSELIYVTVSEIIRKIPSANPVTTAFGVSFVAMLFASKKLAKQYKSLSWLQAAAPLIFCFLGSIIIYFTNLSKSHDVAVIGFIPEGLPPLSTDWNMSDLGRLLGPAISIVIITYMAHISIAKSFATRHGYEVDPTQELFALGLTNFLSSTASAFPTSGALSRSAVNNAVGSKTQIAGLITSLGVLITMVFLTPLFAYLPKFVLGAIVVSSVISLVAYDECIRLWRIKKTDGCLWILAFLGTLFLGILNGLALAVAVSIVIVIFESARPQVSVMWKVRGTNDYKIVKEAKDGVWIQNVLILRFGASMYFANSSFIRDTIMKMLNSMNPSSTEGGVAEDAKLEALTHPPAIKQAVHYIVLEMAPVISVDASALRILVDITNELKARGIQLAFSNVGNRVRRVFENGGFYERIGPEWFLPNTHLAVVQCLTHQRKHASAGGAVVAK